MEEINREIYQTIKDLNAMHHRQRLISVSDTSKDKYGFPLEIDDSISIDPLEFHETAMKLFFETAETFRLIKIVNRHSPLFFQMAASMGKLISRLGSICLTKTVLEQQGESSSFPEDLTIGWLREQTAFLFRKSYASFMESMSSFRYNKYALNLSIRFANLDSRLIATEKKIKQIQTGKIKIDLRKISAVQDEEIGSGEIHRKQPADTHEPGIPDDPNKPIPEKKNCPDSAFEAKGRAFPIDKVFTSTADGREMQKNSAASDKEQKNASGITNEEIMGAETASAAASGTGTVLKTVTETVPEGSAEISHSRTEETAFSEENKTGSITEISGSNALDNGTQPETASIPAMLECCDEDENLLNTPEALEQKKAELLRMLESLESGAWDYSQFSYSEVLPP